MRISPAPSFKQLPVFRFVCLLLALAVGGGLARRAVTKPPEAARAKQTGATGPDAATRARVSELYGRVPMSFEANRGQVDEEVKFLARGQGYSLFLTPGEAVLTLSRPQDKKKERGLASLGSERRAPRAPEPPAAPDVVRMKLVGANQSPSMSGIDPLPAPVNYLKGNDPSKWRGAEQYARVKYDEVYPGVDLIYYGNQRRLEYDFVLAPGAEVNDIRLSFSGARQVRVAEDGVLVLETGGGEVRQHTPVGFSKLV